MTLPALPRFPLRRFAGALAVLVLHALIVVAFIHATRVHVEIAKPAREILLWFAPPKSKAVTPPPAAPAAQKRKAIAPALVYPDYKGISLPPAWQGTALKGLPVPFDCAPQNQHNLTTQELAQCNAATVHPRHDSDEVDYADHTNRAHDAALWARQRARKNAPMLLPCMSPAGFNPLYTAACLAKSAVTGKLDAENQPGYQDMPDHIANEGDTRMAPVPH